MHSEKCQQDGSGGHLEATSTACFLSLSGANSDGVPRMCPFRADLHFRSVPESLQQLTLIVLMRLSLDQYTGRGDRMGGEAAKGRRVG